MRPHLRAAKRKLIFLRLFIVAVHW
jgi:hypothetical protein